MADVNLNAMGSVFDSTAFNERLFFARPESSSCPSGAEDSFLVVDPNVALHARAYWTLGARASFFVFHGNGEVVADYDTLAQRYHTEVQANLIVVDYRGYGLSTGIPTFRDCIKDALPVISALQKSANARLTGPHIVLGRSLGGACAAELAGTEPCPVDAAVLESAPADLLGILRRRDIEPPIEFTDEERSVFDPAPKLARCQIPVLILHGEEDNTIRPHEARANFSRVRHPASRLCLIPGRGHGDVLFDPLYYQRLSEFVDRVIEARAGIPAPLRAHGQDFPRWSLDGIERRLDLAVEKSRRSALSRVLYRGARKALRMLRAIG
jgi:pimeloyl-ACP methyl ester carboxylesterase